MDAVLLGDKKMPFENLLNISVKKDCVDYLAALLTPTIAVAGLYIAFNQKRIEEARLRHELFERRYKQFDVVMNCISSVIVSGNMTYEDEMQFISDILGMRFIFDEDIEEYVKGNILDLARRIQLINKLGMQVENPGERKIELKRNLMESRAVFEGKTLKYMQFQQPSITTDLWRYLTTLCEKIKNAAD